MKSSQLQKITSWLFLLSILCLLGNILYIIGIIVYKPLVNLFGL